MPYCPSPPTPITSAQLSGTRWGSARLMARYGVSAASGPEALPRVAGDAPVCDRRYRSARHTQVFRIAALILRASRPMPALMPSCSCPVRHHRQ